MTKCNLTLTNRIFSGVCRSNTILEFANNIWCHFLYYHLNQASIPLGSRCLNSHYFRPPRKAYQIYVMGMLYYSKRLEDFHPNHVWMMSRGPWHGSSIHKSSDLFPFSYFDVNTYIFELLSLIINSCIHKFYIQNFRVLWQCPPVLFHSSLDLQIYQDTLDTSIMFSRTFPCLSEKKIEMKLLPGNACIPDNPWYNYFSCVPILSIKENITSRTKQHK